MPKDPFKIPIEQLQKIIEDAKPALIDAIGVEALKFVDDNFVKQGFQGETFQPWPKTKKIPKKQRGAKKILIESGTLRRSIVKQDEADHSHISTDIPYAQIHNEGGEIHMGVRAVILSFRNKRGSKRAVFSKASTATHQQKANIGAHVIRMPKRQFVGPSPVLNKACEKAIITILKPRLITYSK